MMPIHTLNNLLPRAMKEQMVATKIKIIVLKSRTKQ